MFFFTIIVALLLFLYLRSRLGGLERRVALLEARQDGRPWPEAKSSMATAGTSGILTPAVEPAVAAADAAVSAEAGIPDQPAGLPPVPEFSALEWFKEDWMLKLGSLLIFLGFAWLVTYAFMNNWIGPAGRITFGLVTGVLIVLLGDWRVKKQPNQGTVLLALGAGVIMLSMYAAREAYGFFTPLSALAILALVPAYIALASWRYRRQSLAVLGLIAGAIVPAILGIPGTDLAALFSYLLALTLAYLSLIRFTGWRSLSLISFFIFFMYSALSFNVRGSDKDIMLAFATIFTLLYFLATLLAVIRDRGANKFDLLLAGASGLYYLAWISALVPAEYQSLAAAAAALLFVIGAFLAFQRTDLKEPMLIYAGVAVFYLGAATAFELEGQALVIAFTLEAAAISWLSARLSGRLMAGQIAGALLLLPALLSISSIDIYKWRESFIHDDFFVLAILALSFLFLGFYYYFQGQTRQASQNEIMNTGAYFLVGALYVLILIRLMMQSIAENDTDTANVITLLIYTVIGLSFYLRGVFRGWRWFKIPGELLLAYVVLRLLLVEVWRMSLSGRIIVFFAVGVMLIASAFLKGRKK